MKQQAILVTVFLLFSSHNLSAGFLEDLGRAVKDGANKGIQEGLGTADDRNQRNTGTNRSPTRIMPSQRQMRDDTRGEQLYKEGKDLFDRSRFREAIPKFEQVLPIARANNNQFGERSCLFMIGVCYQKSGDHPKAIQYLQQAVAVNQRSGDRKGEGYSLLMLAESYEVLKDYQNAIKVIRQKLEIDKQLKDSEGEKLDLAMLAEFQAKSGDYHNAASNLENTVALSKSRGDKTGESMELTALCNNYDMLGDYVKAISCKERGLQLARESGDKTLEMEHLANIASSYNDLGNYGKAIDYYDKAIAIGGITKNKEVESIRVNRAICYLALGDNQKAINLLDQALASNNSLKDKTEQLVILYQLGNAHLSVGNYSKAINYYEQCLLGVQTTNDTRLEKFIIGDLSIAYLLDGNKAKAEKTIKNSKDNLKKALYYLLLGQPKDGISLIPVKEFTTVPEELFAGQSKELIVGTYTVLGLSLEMLGDKKTSHVHFDRAIRLIETQWEELTEDQKVYFMGTSIIPPYSRLTPYEGFMRVSTPEEGFLYSEATKARVLLGQLAGKEFKSGFNVPDKLREDEKKINEDIAGVARQQDAAISKNNKDGLVSLQKTMNSLKTERARFVEKLRKSYPEYAAIRYPKPLKASEIKLYPDEVLFEYAVTDTNTLAWLVKDGKVLKQIAVDIRKPQLEELINRYRANISDPKMLRAPGFDYETGHKLYSLLVKDFMPLISKNDKIIVVPDKKLGLLPFEALVTKIPEKKGMVTGRYGNYPDGISYLGDEYQISYYQSASALTIARTLDRGGKPEKALFVLADPVFDASDVRLSAKTQPGAKKSSPLMRAVEDVTGLKLVRLDQTGNLGKDLIKLFGEQGTDQLTGIEANEANLKKTDLSKYRYLVFATHGILDGHVSGIMEPALVLSQVGNKENQDGFLTMSKVMGLRLRGDVAALTACETGSGKLVSGEGVMGLGRAFQYAGAKSVLASLWSVAEDSTVKLVEKFFMYLKAGNDRMTALRMARADIRKEGYEHPFFWSPFILIGEGK